MYPNIINESVSNNRQRLSRLEYLKYGGLAVFFFAMIILYVLDFPYFFNTFEVHQLIIIALFLGVIVGLGLGYLFRASAEDLTETIQIYVFFVILSMIFMPLVMNLSNHLLSFTPVKTETVELFEIQPFLGDRFGVLKDEMIKPTGYKVYFFRNNEIAYIRTKENIYPNLERGDTFKLKVRQGLWGYDFVIL